MVSELRFKKGLPDLAANGPGESLQVLSAGAHEHRRLDLAQ
jgi:hypothetical protein